MNEAKSIKTDICPPRSGLARFARDEDGGIIIFSLYIFILMLMVGGMAVDLMRFETTRTKLQGTVDRAVLAAADLETEDPEGTVIDWFTKAGMIDFLQGDPDVDEGLNYRTVTADARADVGMMFMNMMGIETMSAPAVGTAEERITNVEISLVLDVSSSMEDNSKDENLEDAATTFVTSVLGNNTMDAEGLITISLVSYAGVVNTGPTVGAFYNVARDHNYSNCFLLPDSAFNTVAMSQSVTYKQVSHYDFGDTRYTDPYEQPIQQPWCFPGTTNQIVVHSTDDSEDGELISAIEDLEFFGNTAIDLGMAWGVAMLDPSARNIVNSIYPSSSPVYNRPLPYNDPTDNIEDTLKVVVLMTDGENTIEYDLHDDYKSGMSDIWFWKEYDSQDIHEVPTTRQSIRLSNGGTPFNYWDDTFYWPGASSWSRIKGYPRGMSEYEYRTHGGPTPIGTSALGEGTRYNNRVYNASWPDIYATWVYYRVNNEFYARPYNDGYISWNKYLSYDQVLVEVVNGTEADTRLSTICSKARAEGIVIYTVAFEAPTNGVTAMQNCANAPGRFFDVEGTDIEEAFSAIASDIRQLKLTQ